MSATEAVLEALRAEEEDALQEEKEEKEEEEEAEDSPVASSSSVAGGEPYYAPRLTERDKFLLYHEQRKQRGPGRADVLHHNVVSRQPSSQHAVLYDAVSRARSVDLTGSTGFDFGVGEALSAAIVSNANLHTLVLDHVDLSAVSFAVWRSAESLVHVSLAHCELGQQNIASAGAWLRNAPHLATLDVSGNFLSDAGTRLLCVALGTSSARRRAAGKAALAFLNVSNNAVRDEGGGALVALLGQHPLLELDMSENMLTDAVGEALLALPNGFARVLFHDNLLSKQMRDRIIKSARHFRAQLYAESIERIVAERRRRVPRALEAVAAARERVAEAIEAAQAEKIERRAQLDEAEDGLARLRAEAEAPGASDGLQRLIEELRRLEEESYHLKEELKAEARRKRELEIKLSKRAVKMASDAQEQRMLAQNSREEVAHVKALTNKAREDERRLQRQVAFQRQAIAARRDKTLAATRDLNEFKARLVSAYVHRMVAFMDEQVRPVRLGHAPGGKSFLLSDRDTAKRLKKQRKSLWVGGVARPVPGDRRVAKAAALEPEWPERWRHVLAHMRDLVHRKRGQQQVIQDFAGGGDPVLLAVLKDLGFDVDMCFSDWGSGQPAARPPDGDDNDNSSSNVRVAEDGREQARQWRPPPKAEEADENAAWVRRRSALLSGPMLTASFRIETPSRAAPIPRGTTMAVLAKEAKRMNAGTLSLCIGLDNRCLNKLVIANDPRVDAVLELHLSAFTTIEKLINILATDLKLPADDVTDVFVDTRVARRQLSTLDIGSSDDTPVARAANHGAAVTSPPSQLPHDDEPTTPSEPLRDKEEEEDDDEEVEKVKETERRNRGGGEESDRRDDAVATTPTKEVSGGLGEVEKKKSLPPRDEDGREGVRPRPPAKGRSKRRQSGARRRKQTRKNLTLKSEKQAGESEEEKMETQAAVLPSEERKEDGDNDNNDDDDDEEEEDDDVFAQALKSRPVRRANPPRRAARGAATATASTGSEQRLRSLLSSGRDAERKKEEEEEDEEDENGEAKSSRQWRPRLSGTAGSTEAQLAGALTASRVPALHVARARVRHAPMEGEKAETKKEDAEEERRQEELFWLEQLANIPVKFTPPTAPAGSMQPGTSAAESAIPRLDLGFVEEAPGGKRPVDLTAALPLTTGRRRRAHGPPARRTAETGGARTQRGVEFSGRPARAQQPQATPSQQEQQFVYIREKLPSSASSTSFTTKNNKKTKKKNRHHSGKRRLRVAMTNALREGSAKKDGRGGKLHRRTMPAPPSGRQPTNERKGDDVKASELGEAFLLRQVTFPRRYREAERQLIVQSGPRPDPTEPGAFDHLYSTANGFDDEFDDYDDNDDDDSDDYEEGWLPALPAPPSPARKPILYTGAQRRNLMRRQPAPGAADDLVPWVADPDVQVLVSSRRFAEDGMDEDIAMVGERRFGPIDFSQRVRRPAALLAKRQQQQQQQLEAFW